LLRATVGTCLELAPTSAVEFIIKEEAPELDTLLMEFLITFRLLEELLCAVAPLAVRLPLKF
jgi:hypothetical protein